MTGGHLALAPEQELSLGRTLADQAAWWPWLVAAPLAGVSGWIAVAALLLRAWRLHREVKDQASPSRGGPKSERGSDPAGGDTGE